MGARPCFIASLIDDLFCWGREDDIPELIKSCIFHYEIEVIHPFEDGNGRMGRLWQTVILKQWNPLFAWIPIETMIYDEQQKYYETLAYADKIGESTPFIEFMMEVIYKAMLLYKEEMTSTNSDLLSDLSSNEKEAYRLLLKYLNHHDAITTSMASQIISKSQATTRRYLSHFVELNLMSASGNNRNRCYHKK